MIMAKTKRNHEVFVRCPCCGNAFDAHYDWLTCPTCGYQMKDGEPLKYED